MKHAIRDEIPGVIAFIAAIWAVFLVHFLLPFDLNRFGITPRTLPGLVGIGAMPFLHASFKHLLGNTVPLFLLLALLAGSRVRSAEIVLGVMLVGGTLLWLAGRPFTHVGASLLIFGLMTFLIVSGILERRLLSLSVSLLVGILYGGTLFWGVLPRFGSQVSWDGHLCGAVAGGVIAYVATRSIGRERGGAA